jgi:hypothetical protein
MSCSQNNSQVASNEAPKIPAPGTATPAPVPQQNQGDKSAPKPSEQRK